MSHSVFAQEQKVRYNIGVLGMNVGELSVTQSGEKGNLDIHAVTDVNVKIIVPYRVKFVQNSTYRQGHLENFHVQTLKNGKINSDSRLERNGDSYMLINDGDTTMVTQDITYSGSMLYFNEPVDVPEVYKERNGEVQQIKSLGNHIYTIKDDTGKKAHKYYYEDGILKVAELKHPLATIYLKRIISSK
ncbi:MAG: DUF6134 family protein [Draconibacterium sp.]